MIPLLRRACLASILLGGTVAADGPPKFFEDTLPAQTLGPLMEAYGALNGEDAALDPKTRELIALAVAAQIPCDYCVKAHGDNARDLGASGAELREAAATAGFVRMWSTVLQGADYDFEAFGAEHEKMRAAAR